MQNRILGIMGKTGLIQMQNRILGIAGKTGL